jgi:adenine-specific DNA-methyltransferase
VFDWKFFNGLLNCTILANVVDGVTGEKMGEQLCLEADDFAEEAPEYLQEQIITYIGNKRALLPFIGKGVSLVKDRLGKKKISFLDLFSGTGIVSRYMKQHASRIIANDLEIYSEVTNSCYLSNASDVDHRLLLETLKHLKAEIKNNWTAGFIAELYAPDSDESIKPGERVFYTRRNAEYIDTARQQISRLPVELQKYFLAPLLAKASVHANTSGVFKGFYKSKEGIGQFGGHAKDALARILRDIEIDLPVFSKFSCDISIKRLDANNFFSVVDCNDIDLAYLDPPYNQHPYGSNYFMLNLIASYVRPSKVSAVSGIPVDWNRSKYNKRREAEDALFSVIEQCPAKFVMISYNSEGFIAHERFLERMKNIGKLTVLETPYNTFRGSRNLNNRPIHVTEFLYLLEK